MSMLSIAALARSTHTPLRPLAAACLLALAATHGWAGVPAGVSFGTLVDAGGMKLGGEFQSSASASYTVDDGDIAAYANGHVAGFSLHAKAWTSQTPNLPAYCTVYTCSWQTYATVTVWDTIVLHAPAGATEPDTFDYDFTIDGTKVRGPWAYGAGAYAAASFSVSTDPGAWYKPQSRNLSSGVTEVKGTLTALPGQDLTFYLMASLGVSAYSGGSADFSHTMAFHLEVPDGWTYTSASGRFSPAPAPVPEPASLALMLCGIAGLGLRMHRRAAATAV